MWFGFCGLVVLGGLGCFPRFGLGVDLLYVVVRSWWPGLCVWVVGVVSCGLPVFVSLGGVGQFGEFGVGVFE